MIFVADIGLNDLWQRPQELATRLGAEIYIHPGKKRFGLLETRNGMKVIAVPIWHFRSKYPILNWFCLRFSGVLNPLMTLIQRHFIRKHLPENPQWFVQSVQLSHLASGNIHFDYIDKWDFDKPAPGWMHKRFESIVDRATSMSVAHPGLKARNDCTIVPNASRNWIPGKVYGYWGVIGDLIDWEWIFGLLEADSRRLVVMIGPKKTEVPYHERLIVLNPVPSDSLWAFARLFDYGIIPWKRTGLTEAVDPVKAHEYASFGLLILSTLGEYKTDGGTWEDRTKKLKEILQ